MRDDDTMDPPGSEPDFPSSHQPEPTAEDSAPAAPPPPPMSSEPPAPPEPAPSEPAAAPQASQGSLWDRIKGAIGL